MPDYVYAQHDFAPENPDEVSFRIGDRIEVVEKDELYGDGWWQVSAIHFNMACAVHLRSHLALASRRCVLRLSREGVPQPVRGNRGWKARLAM